MQNRIYSGAEEAVPAEIKKIVGQLAPSQRKKLAEGCDMALLSKLFSNEGLMAAVNAFLQNGMNVSVAARALYMHRNTLIYKLNAVKKLTGFDLKKFNEAVKFEILYEIYSLGEEQR